jgi:hypothetical protein
VVESAFQKYLLVCKVALASAFAVTTGYVNVEPNANPKFKPVDKTGKKALFCRLSPPVPQRFFICCDIQLPGVEILTKQYRPHLMTWPVRQLWNSSSHQP